jgi:hypothetical protein
VSARGAGYSSGEEVLPVNIGEIRRTGIIEPLEEPAALPVEEPADVPADDPAPEPVPAS